MRRGASRFDGATGLADGDRIQPPRQTRPDSTAPPGSKAEPTPAFIRGDSAIATQRDLGPARRPRPRLRNKADTADAQRDRADRRPYIGEADRAYARLE